jgi:hypothetical protein
MQYHKVVFGTVHAIGDLMKMSFPGNVAGAHDRLRLFSANITIVEP